LEGEKKGDGDKRLMGRFERDCWLGVFERNLNLLKGKEEKERIE